ncbi:MAG: hypothetical protein IJE08_01290 [Clostridia bacterium]|nr:hypothetical protein [Clostridia bacterium]
MAERINYDSRKKIILSYDRRTPVVIKVPGTEQLKQGMRLSPNLPSLQAFGWAMTTNIEGFKAYRLPGDDYQSIILSFEAGAQDVTLTIDGQPPKKYERVKTVQLLDGVIELTFGRRSPASGDTQTVPITSGLNATRPGIFDTIRSRPGIAASGPVVLPTPPAPANPPSAPSTVSGPTVLTPPAPRTPSPSIPAPANPPLAPSTASGPTVLTPPAPRTPSPSIPALANPPLAPSAASAPTILTPPAPRTASTSTPAPANPPPTPVASRPAQPADEDLRARVRELEIERSDAQRTNLELQDRLDEALRMRDQALARTELFDLNEPEIRTALEEYRSSLNVLRSCSALSGPGAESVEGLLDQAGQLVNRAEEQLRLLIEHRERRAAQINHAVSTGSGLVEREV